MSYQNWNLNYDKHKIENIAETFMNLKYIFCVDSK